MYIYVRRFWKIFINIFINWFYFVNIFPTLDPSTICAHFLNT